jgi:hypothetical protein
VERGPEVWVARASEVCEEVLMAAAAEVLG